jgi:hypothetical protein
VFAYKIAIDRQLLEVTVTGSRPTAAVELHQLHMAGTTRLADLCAATDNSPSAQAGRGPRHRHQSLVLKSFLNF